MQRAPPMFGRATIRLGTSPHSSLVLLLTFVDYCWFGVNDSCYGRPMEQGRPLYFHPVVSSFYLLSFFMATHSNGQEIIFLAYGFFSFLLLLFIFFVLA